MEQNGTHNMKPTKPRFNFSFRMLRRSGYRLGICIDPYTWQANEWVSGPSEKGVRFTLDLLFVAFKCTICHQEAYYEP
jgi:hypothetical protein